jgi:hypothetical protein
MTENIKEGEFQALPHQLSYINKTKQKNRYPGISDSNCRIAKTRNLKSRGKQQI